MKTALDIFLAALAAVLAGLMYMAIFPPSAIAAVGLAFVVTAVAGSVIASRYGR